MDWRSVRMAHSTFARSEIIGSSAGSQVRFDFDRGRQRTQRVRWRWRTRAGRRSERAVRGHFRHARQHVLRRNAESRRAGRVDAKSGIISTVAGTGYAGASAATAARRALHNCASRTVSSSTGRDGS
jgi:hypothetical protein